MITGAVFRPLAPPTSEADARVRAEELAKTRAEMAERRERLKQKQQALQSGGA